jgi:hypothetical protein
MGHVSSSKRLGLVAAGKSASFVTYVAVKQPLEDVWGCVINGEILDLVDLETTASTNMLVEAGP